jgi:hypothetical protein
VCDAIHSVVEDDTLKMKIVAKIATVLADTTLHQTKPSCPKIK